MRETKSCNFLLKLLIVFLLTLVSVSFTPMTHSSAESGGVSPESLDAVGLQKQGKFKASDSSITIKQDDKANGIMISGDAADFQNTVFSYGDTYDLDSIAPEYLVIDALAQRKKKIELAFYLDNSSKPFVTIELAKQRKAEIWSTVKNRCVRLSKKDMTGSHKLRFKVITQEVGSLQLVVRSILFFKNDIPMLDFDLDESQGTIAEMNGDSKHDTECYGKVSLRIPENYQSEYSKETYQSATYELDYIRGRGNSTWWTEKKPYKFKLMNKQDLLGMGANKHWVLLANYYDVTMLRNKVTYWLGAQLGMEFTPQCEFVNVVMNGEYLGSYYLCEQVRVGKSRVNIDNLEKDEATKAATDEATISGGYLLAMEPYGEELRKAFSTDRNRYIIESPSFEDYVNDAQFNYISNYVQKTEEAIYGLNFQDADGKSYQEYLDIDSAVDYYWIQEISKNGDAFVSPSTYLYKKRNGKLYWGPLWDFDYVAWGATQYYGNSCEGYTQNNRTWFERLFNDPVFYQKVVDRWPAIKEKLLQACKDGGQIDIYSQKQYESQKANYGIWKKYSDTYGDEWIEGENQTAVTYDSEVERFKLWVRQRVEWIDANLNGLRKTYYTVKFMVDDKELLSMQVEQERYIGMLPDIPVKEGYVFMGWYATVNQDGEATEYKLTEDTTITADMIVTAKWRDKSASKPIRQIGFSRDEYYTFWDDMLQIQHCVLPFDADVSEVTWSSSDETVAVVTGGLINAVAHSGDVVITASAPNGVSRSCVVHIMDYNNNDYVGLRSIELDQKSITVSKGGYGRVLAMPNPKNAAMWYNLSYASSDEEILKVNDCGYVYGVAEGTAVVVVYARYDAQPVFCTVTVVDDGKADVLPEVPAVTLPDATPVPTPDASASPLPGDTPLPDVTPVPDDTPTPDVTPSPSPDVTPMPIQVATVQPSVSPKPDENIVKAGTKFTVNGLKYKVLTAGNKRTVVCTGAAKAGQTKLTVPATVKYQGKLYKVTKIDSKAFSGNKKLTKVTLGSNIAEIGSKAFSGCKNLKEISIKSASLTKVGKNAIAGTSSKIKIKAPKKKKEKYLKLFGI